MSNQTKETSVKLEKLKRNEIICGILGLVTGIIALVFLFVNMISFTGELTEDASITLSTNIWHLLDADFTLHNKEWGGLSLWALCNPNIDISFLQTFIEIFFTMLAWCMLIGVILSIIFYILFLCKKRFYWFCEVAIKAAVLSPLWILLGLILGQFNFSGNRIYAEGVNYNMIIPIIYSIVTIVICICVNHLLSYSKERQDILKNLRTKKEMEAAVAAQPSTGGIVSVFSSEMGVAYNTESPGVAASSENAQGQISPMTPISESAKQALISKFHGNLSETGMVAFKKHIDKLNVDKYQRLIQMSLKKKVAAILFAIFLGGIGVDRFYVGDVKIGILKIIGSVVAVICNSFIPIFGLIIYIANWIWKFADIFISYKKIYDKNYENAMMIIAGN